MASVLIIIFLREYWSSTGRAGLKWIHCTWWRVRENFTWCWRMKQTTLGRHSPRIHAQTLASSFPYKDAPETGTATDPLAPILHQRKTPREPWCQCRPRRKEGTAKGQGRSLENLLRLLAVPLGQLSRQLWDSRALAIKGSFLHLQPRYLRPWLSPRTSLN